MAVSMQPAIEKLSFENYMSWAHDVKFLLDEKGLWEIVLGTEELSAAPGFTTEDSKTSDATILLKSYKS